MAIDRLTGRRPHLHPGQSGSIAVMSAGALILMVGVCGMAVEMSQIYNRKVDLHNVATIAALAAAREVDGTAAGIDAALAKAEAAVRARRYAYRTNFSWSDTAIRFSDHPRNGTWVDAATARNSPATRLFVSVSTDGLGDAAGLFEPLLLQIISPAFASIDVGERAVAGRTSIKVLPMGVCGMSASEGASRTNMGSSGTSVELVEYGFRRGISYDLMRLNPNGTAPENFVIDPYVGPGMTAANSYTTAASVRPFVCSGKMWVPGLLGGSIRVARPFPLDQLYHQLNSRFDLYEGPAAQRCEPRGAPPDVNVKQYSAPANINWMKVAPTRQSPPETFETDRLRTMADLPEMPAGQGADAYGPLWTYAKAVPFSAYAAGTPEPDTGYSTFSTSNWSVLYKPAPIAAGYPTPNPFMVAGGATTLPPSVEHRAIAERGRRVLHIPLLACPIGPGTNVSANVLGVGRFFMTVPATQTTLHAEFAGLLPPRRLAGTVEVFE